MEIAYNNGLKRFEECKPDGKKWTEGKRETKDSLFTSFGKWIVCLLYTSDAADEEDSVDLGGRRIIKKKKKKQKNKKNILSTTYSLHILYFLTASPFLIEFLNISVSFT